MIINFLIIFIFDKEDYMIDVTTLRNIAVNIEAKGIEFYEKMNVHYKLDIITDIIQQEKEHIETFHALFEKIEGTEAIPTLPHFYEDKDMLTAAFANLEVFAKIDLKQVKTIHPVEIAIQIEKESILFYHQLEDMLDNKDRNSKEVQLVQQIRQEEIQHLVQFVKLKQKI